jgi:hypothetical protein
MACMFTRRQRFYDPQKRFMEEMILRFEKAFRSVNDSIEKNTATLVALRIEIERHTEKSTAEWRAQRQTLLHILDRLDGNSGPSTAT